MEQKSVPNSWREAIISIIPKKGKDRLECSSYRPITVLNVNYKLFTFQFKETGNNPARDNT